MYNPNVVIRRAEACDLQAVLGLLSSLQLPTEGVTGHFPNFYVARCGKEIVGCIGLEVYKQVALLRSLAVCAPWQNRGLGRSLTQRALQEAMKLGMEEIILLTTTAERFFCRLGFVTISRAQVPPEVQTSVEFQSACPETATCMRLSLRS